jgi:rRNA biogenesis protein RRP5
MGDDDGAAYSDSEEDEAPRAARKGAAPATASSVTASALSAAAAAAAAAEEEDEEAGAGGASSVRNAARREKRRAAAAEEAETSRLEARLASGEAEQNPETAEDFERLVLAQPGSSLAWIRFMAWQLSLAEVEAADTCSRRRRLQAPPARAARTTPPRA